MERISELVNEYYEAIFADDYEKKRNILFAIRDAIFVIMISRGNYTISELADLFDELPDIVRYSPSDEVVNQVTEDLQQVLLGLESRMDDLIQQKRNENPELSLAAIYLLVKSENYWQVERIVDSEDHIIGERAELDVVASVFLTLGFDIDKTWIAVIDERTCLVCREMNGTTIPFGEVFVYNDGESDYEITLDSHYSEFAHAHSHCRCRIEYSIRRR